MVPPHVNGFHWLMQTGIKSYMGHEANIWRNKMGISSFMGLKGMIHGETNLSQEEIEKTADSIMSILDHGLFK